MEQARRGTREIIRVREVIGVDDTFRLLEKIRVNTISSGRNRNANVT